MPYEVNGQTIETDANGYLADPNDWNEEVAKVIAEAEGVELTQEHWDVMKYLRDTYFEENGHQPNNREMVKAMSKIWGRKIGSKDLFMLFPGGGGPSKQAAKIAGLPETKRKGGY